MKFKLWIFTAMLCLTASYSVQAESIKDSGFYFGCRTEEQLNQFFTALATKDKSTIEYLSEGGRRCILLVSDFKISVVERNFTTVKIRVYFSDGEVELWTVSEALE